jgi:hypothetical protein
MPSSRLMLSVLFVVSACACAARNPPPLVPAPGPPPPLRLDFRPPVDVALVETVRSSLQRGSAPQARAAEMTTVSRFTPEAGGWRLTQRVTQARTLREGKMVETPVDELLSRFSLQVRLAEDGTFVGVLEPGAARAAIRQMGLAEPVVVELERLLAPEAVEARTRREWELKYGGLYGRALEEGQKSYGVGTVALEGREVTYLLERTFAGMVLTEHGEAVVLALRCLERPGEDAPEPVREALEAARELELTPGVQCEGEQVLGRGRVLPIRRSFTLRVPVEGESWTWTVQSALESLQPLEEEQKP